MLAKIGWMVALGSMVAATGAVLLERNAEIKSAKQEQIRVEGKLAITSEDWPAAEAKYAAVLKDNPDDGQAWFMMGLAQHYQQKYKAASESFRQAEDLGYEPGLVHYNIACGLALQGKKQEALAEIERACDFGGLSPEIAMTDEDLVSLRDEPRFKDAIIRMQAFWPEEASGKGEAKPADEKDKSDSLGNTDIITP